MSAFDEGSELHKRGKFKEALEAYLAALNEDFDDHRTLFYAGSCLFQMGHHGAAASFLARSLQSKPGDIDALINLGACYRNENNFVAADEIWMIARALAHEKKNVAHESGALVNLAGLKVHQGLYPEALAMFDEALAINPEFDHGIANRAMAHLALGHWREGWQGYDAHLMLNSRRERRYIDTPMWNGEPGKKVVVYGEQGVGDEIMFASMIPDLMKVCSSVIFDCHPRLMETWKRAFGISCYGTRKTQDIPWFDTEKPEASVAIGSLGRHFRNEESAFPGTPFLVANEEKRAAHRVRSRGLPRIGISWQGGTKITGSPFRKIGLDELRPLFGAVDADWFSLQYTPGAIEEAAVFEEKTGIRLKHYPSFVNPFDLSGLVDFTASLDLVITIPTTVVHVAGALGVPCWVLVPQEAAWRHTGNQPGERREKMVWYDSVRLRHKIGPTWGPLIERVAQDLANNRAATRIAAE